MRKRAALPILLCLLAGGGFLAEKFSHEKSLPEDQAIAEIVERARALLAATYPDSARATALRGAHPKASGCVKAVFTVDPDLPEVLRVGSFAHPGEKYMAWIRFSNSAFTPGPDRDPNGRGMALKLVDADPDRANIKRKNPPHDLLFINFPAYFLADANEFLAFVRAGGLQGDQEHALKYFFPGYNPFTWRLRETAIVYRNATREISSPLHTDYWSMTPYKLGPDGALKYAARPCMATAALSPAKDDPDYLRTALTAELKSAPACMELLAQIRVGDMPLDDASREWSQDLSPPRRLGRIEIPAQDISAEGRDETCENLSFNPGHAPEELAPLGGINRVRIKLYEASAAYRLGHNSATATDPEKAWNRF
jgi:hypothetical protein